MHSFPDKLSPRERLIATVGALMVVMLVMLAFARPSAAQVYVVTPDADRLPASVATTMMLDPLQLLQGLDVSDVHAIPHPRCLLYTSPSPRDVEESRMPSSA